MISPPSRSRRRKAGVALLITLALIVIVSLSVIFFFIRSTSNVQVEASRVNHVRADLLAASGQEYVKNIFLQEIFNPVNSTITTPSAGTPTYVPLTGANTAPLRTTSATGTVSNIIPSLTDPNFANLVRQSIAAADANASTDNTSTAAANGRTVGPSVWNTVSLVGGGETFTTGTTPNWIYLNRPAPTATPPAAGGPINTGSSSTIGRFAYNVYNIGGLLDANAAGHPSFVTPAQIPGLSGTITPAEVAAFRSTAAAADLTQLGVQQSAIDSLVAIRNPGATSAATYLDCVAASAAQGFLSPTVTSSATGTIYNNNYFASRQDLIHYVRTHNTAAEDLTNALPYLTTFARDLNAPSWTPPTLAAGQTASTNTTIPNARFAAPGTITHYPDSGTPQTYTVSAGDPLVQRRFSLTRLAWLTPLGPSGDPTFPASDPAYKADILNGVSPAVLAAGTDTAIQSCFGLKWNPGLSRWDYVGSKGGSTVQSSIETLALVAQEAREPNFFELLKAGILSGSLGIKTNDPTPISGEQNGASQPPAPEPVMEANPDRHVLQIGANIIDCQSATNYPTILSFTVPGLTGVNAGLITEIAGTKDLPYFLSMDMVPMNHVFMVIPPSKTNPGGFDRLSSMDIICAPMYFNPHRLSLTAPAGITGPTNVTTSIAGSVTTFLQGQTTYPAVPISPATFTATPYNFGANFVMPTATDFRTTPKHYSNSSSPNALENLYFEASSNGPISEQMVGFLLYSFEQNPANNPNSTAIMTVPLNDATPQIVIQNFQVRLTYPSPAAGGVTKTYTMFSGYESPSNSPTPGVNMDSSFIDTTPTTVTQASLVGAPNLTLWDPRTNRLGPSEAYSRPANPDAPPATVTGGQDPVQDRVPFPGVPNQGNGTPVLNGLWPQGGKTANAAGPFTNMADPDGVFRPADGFLAPASNPYQNLANAATAQKDPARPMILFRPYQSVAELGYVFRDDPWKTLSFFDATSGDSALLDLFSVADEPATAAGHVFLESASTPVVQSLLSNAAQEADEDTNFQLSATQASTIATAYQTYASNPQTLAPPSANSTTAGAISNRSQLVNFLSQLPFSGSGNLDAIKWHREVVPRALADVGQTRTWNLLIDLVAQSGRFPTGSTAFIGSNFVVEGESHLWISVAIDRYTGKIVDQQVESVNE